MSTLGKVAKGVGLPTRDVASTVYKIKYTLNVLPSMLEDDGRIIAALAQSEEMDIFNCPAVKELIQFKWQSYARAKQCLGATIHVCYILTLIAYIQTVYLGTDKSPEANHWLLAALGIWLLYPVYNDGSRVWRIGGAYFVSLANYVDILQIALGYASIVQQYYEEPAAFPAKLIMIITVVTSLFKQFFYMRVLESFSYIVTMMQNVIKDLVVFLVFFAILVFMFSLIFDVIAKNDAAEYHNIHPFFGNFITTFRLALGDFDFGILSNPARPLNSKQHILFWGIWCLMVAVSSLVFLNFIIAEVSNSYGKVRVRVSEEVQRERANLINDVESTITQAYKDKHPELFPQYVVIREAEL